MLGLMLYKGHRKDKFSDRSYRTTISTCPILVKALDLSIHDLYNKNREACQADMQYQGKCNSHELAALFVTEVIQFSLNVLNRPVFLLALDAQNSFDRFLRQVFTTKLYKAGVDGSAVTYINIRLASSAKVYQWKGKILGLASDDTGFEQGGINLSKFYINFTSMIS